jgi:hypothetical protein
MMTMRTRLLAAAAALALPANLAGAQVTGPTTNPTTSPTGTTTTATQTPEPGAPVGQTVPPATTTTTNATQAPVDADQPGVQSQPATQAPPPARTEDAHTRHEAQAPTQTPPPADPAVPATQTQTQTQAGAQTQTPPPGGPVTPATASDIRSGVQVRDTSGAMVGTVESVDATGAVVATGTVRAKLPLNSFGRNAQGLVISLTRAQLEAAAQAATPTPS